MIDDSEPPPADREALLYDYFKWITTLALLVIGGVFSLAQQVDLKLATRDALIVFAPLCLAGAIGLTGADGVVRRRLTATKAGTNPRWLLFVATAALGLGAGAVIKLFWGALQ